MAAAAEELTLLQKIRKQMAKACSLFEPLIWGHKEAVAAIIEGMLPASQAKMAKEVLEKVFIRCRNEIVACRLPADFGARAKQVAAELCDLLKGYQGEQRLRAIRPEVLPPVEVHSRSSLVPDTGLSTAEEAKLLCQFKESIQAITDLFWAVIRAPHRRGDGSSTDKRALLAQYAERRGLSEADAEDVADEAVARALKGLYQYEPRPGKAFMNWLYVIARHAIIDLWRGEGEEFLPKPEEGEAEELPDVGTKPVGRQALEELVAVEAICALLELCAGEPEGLVKALITTFHQIVGHRPKEIIEELGDFTLVELLAEFRRSCLRMAAFDQNEELVSELLQPFQEELGRPDGPGRLVGEMRLEEFWGAQSRADYYIQNVSRRTWKQVATRVRANLGGGGPAG